MPEKHRIFSTAPEPLNDGLWRWVEGFVYSHLF